MTDLTRVKSIFLQAIETCPPDGWPDFLSNVCGDDADLRQQVEALLRAHLSCQPGESPSETVAGLPQTDTDDSFTLTQHGHTPSIGHFELLRLVGRGGMGSVFYAHDRKLDRHVAIKVPRLSVIGNPKLKERFLREAKTAAGLSHDGLITIHEFGIRGDVCFLVTEWCTGGDLSQWLREHPGPHDAASVAAFVKQLADAVSHCHRSRVLHLDIKPGNILLDRSSDISEGFPGRPLLTDFGLARLIEDGRDPSQSSLMLGTPLYMAPEQAECQTERIGPATDVFSIGVLMYELLVGERPFDGDNAAQVMDQVRLDRIVRLPANCRVPKDLRAVCETCLRRSPGDRYTSATELAEDLERYLNGQPVQATPLTPLRRIVHAVQQRERIWQAGLVTVAIEIPMIVLLLLLWIMMTFGLTSSMPQGWQHAAYPFLLVLIAIHVPSLLVGIQSLRYRWWSVPVGLFFSLNFFVPTVLVLCGIIPPMSLYEGQPMAAFLVHYCFCMFAAFQTIACCAALPAAWELRRNGLRR